MQIRRLGWAGLELESSGTSIIIDHLIDPGMMRAFFGPDPDPLIEPERGSAAAALLTHLHRDHGDLAAIEATVGEAGSVLRPRPSRRPTDLDVFLTGELEAGLAETWRVVRICDPHDVCTIGPFTVTALPASDGFGSPQVSWLVEADGIRIVHAGDTLWHGSWWNVARSYGPIDVAFLPANGVLTAYPQWQPAVEVETVMTPAQAVEAACAMGAATLVPIHYNRTFEHEQYYRPVPDAEVQLGEHAARRPVTLHTLTVGEWSAASALTAVTA